MKFASIFFLASASIFNLSMMRFKNERKGMFGYKIKEAKF